MNQRPVAIDGTETLIESAEGQMKVSAYSIPVNSEKAPEFIDITDNVIAAVKEANIIMGVATVYSKHTTAAIKINEWEPLLLEDLEHLLEHIAPKEGNYRHNDFDIRTVNMNPDESPNGHSHCQHLTLGTSESIPIIGGELQLGMYQRIFFIELDCPRSREAVVQVMGV